MPPKSRKTSLWMLLSMQSAMSRSTCRPKPPSTSWLTARSTSCPMRCSTFPPTPLSTSRPDVVLDAIPPDISLDTPPELPPPAPASVSFPEQVAFPYVVAAQGSVQTSFDIQNTGGSTGTLTWQLQGAPEIALTSAPDTLDPDQEATVTLTFDGSDSALFAAATLTVTLDGGSPQTIDIVGVVGSTEIGPSATESITGPPNINHGTSILVALPTAPYSADPSVNVFVPDGFYDRGAQDMVVHFHGFNTNLASTLPYHDYREMLHLSGRNAVLVTPQGPLNQAQRGLRKPHGRRRPASDARRRPRRLVPRRLHHHAKPRRRLSQLALRGLPGRSPPTSGTPSQRLTSSWSACSTRCTARSAPSSDFVQSGGWLRSNTTGGTTANSHANLQGQLAGAGIAFTANTDHATLRQPIALLTPTSAPHNDVTWERSFWLEHLRWAPGATARGPRVELLSVTSVGNTATARWLSPEDPDVVRFEVQAQDPSTEVWSSVAETEPDASEASFAVTSGQVVRVIGVLDAVAPELRSGSDTYRVDPAATVLVVDGFDRTLRGSFAGPAHDFAARVGTAVPSAVASASNEGALDLNLQDYAVVIWLLGDESTRDIVFTSQEQAAVSAYIAGGGRVIVSGSEVAWGLGAQGGGPSFLQSLGATYTADNSGSLEVAGAIGAFTFGGPGAALRGGLSGRPVAVQRSPDAADLLLGWSGCRGSCGAIGRGRLSARTRRR